MGEIKIGTCVYSYFNPEDGGKDRYESKLQEYSDSYSTVELNRTFYKLPMKRTAERWKKNASDDFVFNLKVWQAMTHTTSCPTWRNKKDKLTDSQIENFGYLRANDDIVEAWKRTK